MILTLLGKQGVHEISKDLIYLAEEKTKINYVKIKPQETITLKKNYHFFTRKSCRAPEIHLRSSIKTTETD